MMLRGFRSGLSRFSIRTFSTGQASEVPIPLIRHLRAQTGAPIIECRKALEESQLDKEQALDWLRKRGVAVVNKLSGKETSAGIVSAAISGNVGAIIEINSQTDFVMQTPEVRNFVRTASQQLLLSPSENNVLEMQLNDYDNKTVKDVLHELIASIRENIEIGRVARLQIDQGVVAAYIHPSMADGIGEIACLVSLKTDSNDIASLRQLGVRIAKHITASSGGPLYIHRDEIPDDVLEKEKAIRIDALKNKRNTDLEAMPQAKAQKIVKGLMDSLYKEICLLEQEYLLADMEGLQKKGKKKMTVGDIVADVSKQIGADITVDAFTIVRPGQD